MKILFLTNSFPFPPGEQFIESEINFWVGSHFSEITILPGAVHGSPRPVPEEVHVDTSMMLAKTRLVYAFKALISRTFWIELKWLRQSKRLSAANFLTALRTSANVIKIDLHLSHWFKEHGSVDLIYSYWNDSQCYAACLAKSKGNAKLLVARAHRFDLYEERRAGNYMPLKRQFLPLVDRLYLLTDSAKKYAQDTYGANPEALRVSRLGVNVPYRNSAPTHLGSFKIVSTSFLVPVKRIDKIIDAIADFAELYPEINISWAHIGDGPLRSLIEQRAQNSLGGRKNLCWSFLGHLSNSEVTTYYLDTLIDCFLNSSESEGVPVSIMEAMAAGVPAIAPDVGGISDLVDGECGVLLSSAASHSEIVSALSTMKDKAKHPEFREKAKQKIKNYFDKTKNYPAFIRELEKLAGE
jgi:colanic acid/amylovoran biosynthesis glycosyltransferase